MTIGLLLVWSGLGVALSIKTMLLSWHNCFVGKKRKKAWNVAPLCLFWTI